MMSRITLSLKREGLRGPTPLNTQSESGFPLCFDYQKPVLDNLQSQPPGFSSSQTLSLRSKLPRMQRHAGALEGDVSSQIQQDSEVLTGPAVAGAFEPADDEHCRHGASSTSPRIDGQTIV